MALNRNQETVIVIIFTGSDWCGWCIRLQRGFKTPEFAV
jgi:protein disulfide-isomerase